MFTQRYFIISYIVTFVIDKQEVLRPVWPNFSYLFLTITDKNDRIFLIAAQLPVTGAETGLNSLLRGEEGRGRGEGRWGTVLKGGRGRRQERKGEGYRCESFNLSPEYYTKKKVNERFVKSYLCQVNTRLWAKLQDKYARVFYRVLFGYQPYGEAMIPSFAKTELKYFLTIDKFLTPKLIEELLPIKHSHK